ncbi:MAG: response regulator [Thermodesulfobacteriota bacterium]|nr:response regulator [Thermodesulfobacteriota bacterium]
MTENKIVVLLVDDEPKFLASIAERIRLKGFVGLPAESGEEAIEIARQTQVDVAIVDQKMPGMDGLTTITKLKEIHPGIRTVLLTGYGTEKLREAARALDADYFEKDEMRAFWAFIREYGEKSGRIVFNPRTGCVEFSATAPAAEEAGLMPTRGGDAGRPAYGAPPPMQRLIGETTQMRTLKSHIRNVASLDCPVLILGEKGTGKELAARAIHSLSPRSTSPFIPVDAGAFNEGLLNSELFGREAALDSGYGKKGVFETATAGTVQLKGIQSIGGSTQQKLLQLLTENAILREGGVTAIPLDARVIAAADITTESEQEFVDFSTELYERLNAFILRMPPLRERADDIPLLSNYFLDVYRKEFGKSIETISSEAMAVLSRYSFPGNVRELESAIEQAVILCSSTALEKTHLPEKLRKRRSVEMGGTTSEEKKRFVSLAELEDQYIMEVMQATGGNKSEAARILGINRASLWRKLKKRRLLMDQGRQIKLLIVDDDEKFLNTIAERLGMKDFDVTTAAEGKKAVEAAEQGRFDVAIVDLNMPGMKGKDLLKILKENHKFLEVIILTGYASIDSAVECMKLGAFGYLEKPYDFDKLLEMLKAAYEARLRKKFDQNAKQMAEIESLSVGSSPLSILRALKHLDDGMK